MPTVSVDYGFFGQPEDRAHDTLPVLIVRDLKINGIWSHPVPSKGVVHPYPAGALMADLDFMGTSGSSLSPIRSQALLPSVTLSRVVGMPKLYLKPLPRARARAMEKLSVQFNLCRDCRGPSKTSWIRNLELRWSPGVRCWLGCRALFQSSPTSPQR